VSAFASRWHDCLGGLAGAAERLAPGETADQDARAFLRRLSMQAMLSPLLLAAALVGTLAEALGAAGIVTLVALVIASGWLTGLLGGFGRASRPAAASLLGLMSLSSAAIVAGAGGLASPLALLTVMPLAEALWLGRDRAWLAAGAAASLAVLPLQAWIAAALDLPQHPATAWQWLIPAVYLASLVLRAATFVAEREGQAAAHRPVTAEDVIEAVCLRLTRTGEVLDAGGKVERLLGLRPCLLLGGGLFERIHVGDRVAYLCALSDLREGAPFRSFELRLRAPRAGDAQGAGPAEETYADFAVEVANTGEAELPVIMVLRPAAETAALRAKVAALDAAAEETEVAKSRFLAVVSHELRTPLNAIVGFSDMLESGMLGAFADPRQREYAGLIREAGNHLLAVVTSILDVSRIECGSYPIEPEPFQFRDAVAACGAMMSLEAARKPLVLETEIAPSVGRIVADRRAVQQMLINLISNAIKFTPAGGTVTVGANRLGSRLHFWVSDTGVGIGEEDLGRLGRPFTQLRNDHTSEHQGAGLGLSLVKGLVGLHEGSMMVESAPGEGTVVTISLPVTGPTGRGVAGGEPGLVRFENDEDCDGQVRKIA
jgi:cell cycle sensor histidine kinase DivJ